MIRIFQLKLLRFFTPIIILFLILEIGIRKIPNDYSFKNEYLKNKSNGLEIIFLGSSHAYYGINPEYIQGKSFNGSHISQSLRYDFELLMKFNNSWNNLKTIVIPIDYFTLFSTMESGIESWRVKNYCIYYDIQTSFNIKNYSEVLSISLKNNLKRLENYYKNGYTEISCSEMGYGSDFKEKKNLEFTGKSAAIKQTKANHQYFAYNTQILNEILEFTIKNNITLILYSSPAYSSYRNNLDSIQLKMTIDKLKLLAHDNPNCYYFDFLTTSNYSGEYFRDGNHLNSNGAKMFSNKINDYINKINSK